MNTTREPLVTRASIVAIVTAIIGLLVALGVPISDEVKVALLGLVGVAAPIVVALLTRSKVTPVADPRP